MVALPGINMAHICANGIWLQTNCNQERMGQIQLIMKLLLINKVCDIHLAVRIACKCFDLYMFVFVNFDTLTQVSDFRIERWRVVFLCWMQDSKLGSLRHQIASRLNAHSQTDWAIQDQARNLNSTTHPYEEWAFSPLHITADWLSHLNLIGAEMIFLIEPFHTI